MHELIEEIATVRVKTLSSKDGSYRYALTKLWDSSRLIAVVIGINPSKATQLKGDNTATNAMNFLVDKGYGEMTIVNLFPYRCVKPTELSRRDKEYDQVNLGYIEEACAKADMVLIAWGYEKKYLTQKRKVEDLLRQFKTKVKCFSDLDGNKPQHLRINRDNWELVSYF